MNVYVDYDSTLNDMAYAWLEWLNKEYDRSYTNKDVTHWLWYNELDVDAFKWFKDSVFDDTKPLPYSQEFYVHLKEYYNTIILTSTHDKELEERKNKHIHEYYGASAVIHEHDKFIYAYDEVLGKPNILIDDRPLNCTKWVENGGIAILFNHDNNYNYCEEIKTIHLDRIKHSNDYEQVKEHLRDITISYKNINLG